MQIKTLKNKNNIFLAPMAGITDYAFRLLCSEQGAGLTFTEMISAKAVCYKDVKTQEMALIRPDEAYTSLQIFGSEPLYMAKAAMLLNDSGAKSIDINMGCPAPKIVKNGEGAALMKDIKLAGQIIEAVVKSTDLPVTVKIRKGWDKEHVNAVELAKTAQEAGVKAITVHGRTRDEFYTGTADWEIIKRVKEAVDIPVIGNGDIKSANDVVHMIKTTGCDGVMVGRAALGNPWIFKNILNEINGKPTTVPTDYERYEMINRHIKLMKYIKGERQTVNEMRKHIAWYLKGYKNSARVRDKIFKIDDLDQVIDEIRNILIEGE